MLRLIVYQNESNFTSFSFVFNFLISFCDHEHKPRAGAPCFHVGNDASVVPAPTQDGQTMMLEQFVDNN